MKCMYGERRHVLPSTVRILAMQTAKELMAIQTDAVVSRGWNEMLVAMDQAGLSAKTIKRVCTILDKTVLPYVDDLRNPGGTVKTAGVVQNVRDGDIWISEYLTARGIEPYAIPEIKEGW